MKTFTEADFKKLEKQFRGAIGSIGMDLDARVQFCLSSGTSAEMKILKPKPVDTLKEAEKQTSIYEFHGNVDFYYQRAWRNDEQRKVEMNHGSAGSFTPDDKPLFIRGIAVGEFLKNWKELTAVIKKYCEAYDNMVKHNHFIFEQEEEASKEAKK